MKQSGYKHFIIRFTNKQAIVAIVLSSYITSAFSQYKSDTTSFDLNTQYSEEIYIRTDRDVYISGEKVFLKVSQFSRLTHESPGISKIVYASLLDSLNIPVSQIKIKTDGYTGSGCIQIPDTLKTGNYFIASCTRWMENFPPDLFAYKRITVINPFGKPDDIHFKLGNDELDTVIFYPEGGNFIYGSKMTVGFRCLGKSNEPVSVSGTIRDSLNNIINYVFSGDDGFGLFRMNLAGGDKYCFVTEHDGKSYKKVGLPVSDSGTVALSVLGSNNPDIIKVKILRNNDADIEDKDLKVIVTPVSLPSLVFNVDAFNGGETTINRNTIPVGLSLLTVSDAEGHKYSSRWIYNRPDGAFNITATIEKLTYSPREKVQIAITVKDHENNPVQSDMLVTVARSFTLEDSKGDFSSDLQMACLPGINHRSMITDINDQLIFLNEKELCLNDSAISQNKVVLPEPDGHMISGIIKNTVTGEPLINENIVLSYVGKKALCSFTQTDSEGRFRFISNPSGVQEVVIQPFSMDIDDYYVELDNPFPEVFSKYHSPQLSVDTLNLDLINSAVVSMQINRIYDAHIPRVTVAPQPEEIINDFYGQPEDITLVSDYIRLNSFKEVIKEIVPEAITIKRKGKKILETILRVNNQIYIMIPVVFVDGVPFFDQETVFDIPVEKIDKINLINKPYYISGIQMESIVDIKTFKGDLSAIEFKKPVFRQEFAALQTGSGFIPYDYSEDSFRLSRVPDFRNTLYWNPDVRTDKEGNAIVEFYTSDEPGDYKILIEGFNSEGVKEVTTLEFSVKKDNQ